MMIHTHTQSIYGLGTVELGVVAQAVISALGSQRQEDH